MLSGIIRDVVGYALGSVYAGYAVVFGIEIALFGFSLILLRHIEVGAFTRHATTRDVIAAAGNV
jgi:hypothetical protein